jgi:hypothetical protein
MAKKSKVITEVRVHTGVQLNHQVVTSITCKKHNVSFEKDEAGVWLKIDEQKGLFIWGSNITYMFYEVKEIE